eukprot:11774385-Alexandrium_andersonii.AAC.1
MRFILDYGKAKGWVHHITEPTQHLHGSIAGFDLHLISARAHCGACGLRADLRAGPHLQLRGPRPDHGLRHSLGERRRRGQQRGPPP